jgi:thioredoxin-like negative regulator of GroEL
MGVTVKFNAALKNLINVNFGNSIVFIKFGTDWCAPCQELDKILVNFPDSLLYHVNLDNDEFEHVMEEYNFKSIPYTIVKYRQDTRTFSGVKNEEQINKLIDDMKS